MRLLHSLIMIMLPLPLPMLMPMPTPTPTPPLIVILTLTVIVILIVIIVVTIKITTMIVLDPQTAAGKFSKTLVRPRGRSPSRRTKEMIKPCFIHPHAIYLVAPLIWFARAAAVPSHLANLEKLW